MAFPVQQMGLLQILLMRKGERYKNDKNVELSMRGRARKRRGSWGELHSRIVHPTDTLDQTLGHSYVKAPGDCRVKLDNPVVINIG